MPFTIADITVATVPTVYGIETTPYVLEAAWNNRSVATVPTVYGIETLIGNKYRGGK